MILLQGMMAAPYYIFLTLVFASSLGVGLVVLIHYFRKKTDKKPWGCVPTLIIIILVIILTFCILWFNLIFGDGGYYT